MSLIRTIAMNTDHDFYGKPVETTRVELYCDEKIMTPEQIEIMKRQQEMRLRSHAKRMPHRYWQQPADQAQGSTLPRLTLDRRMRLTSPPQIHRPCLRCLTAYGSWRRQESLHMS